MVGTTAAQSFICHAGCSCAVKSGVFCTGDLYDEKVQEPTYDVALLAKKRLGAKIRRSRAAGSAPKASHFHSLMQGFPVARAPMKRDTNTITEWLETAVKPRSWVHVNKNGYRSHLLFCPSQSRTIRLTAIIR